MKIINPSHEILYMPKPAEVLRLIERAGRTCYKSEGQITEDSAKAFVERLIMSGHLSPLEHVSITVKFICDRGVSHELVRHRLASYSQSSTRYCNYSKDKFGSEITVIKPPWLDVGVGSWNSAKLYSTPFDRDEEYLWLDAMLLLEKTYMSLLEHGWKPEQARSVLPNSLKTEIVMTCNIREWRHVLKQRCDKAAHPQMREIMVPLRDDLKEMLPELFGNV